MDTQILKDYEKNHLYNSDHPIGFFNRSKIMKQPYIISQEQLDEVSSFWIKMKLNESGWSQSDLAREMHIDRQRISAFINGTKKPTNSNKVAMILLFRVNEAIKLIEK